MRLQGGYKRNFFCFLLILLFIGAEFLFLPFGQAPIAPPYAKATDGKNWAPSYAVASAATHANGAVVINEVAWMGNGVSANDEWIELYNASGVDIDLTGRSLAARDGSPKIELDGIITAGGYYLMERSNDDSAPLAVADLIYTGALGNGGEILELRDSGGIVVDLINASEGWPAGDNTLKLTMERTADGVWQSSALAGGTPGGANGSGVIEPEEPSATSTPPDNTSPQPSPSQEEGESVRYSLGSILINEFVSDPQDGDTEWVELYNTMDASINLDGWTIEEGSGAKTTLEGEIGVSGNDRYYVLEKPKGNLNNKGDIIILRWNGALIDRVRYGNWDDGNTGNNAPVTGDPNSVARKLDGTGTFNNQNDFVITTTLTKGGSNIITALTGEGEEEISAADRAQYDYSDDIFITEIMPNPFGDDSLEEFVEIYNAGGRDVDLSGWRLGDESKRRFSLEKLEEGNEVIIKAGAYLAIYRELSKIALNNSGDTVKLWQPFEDRPGFEISYEKAVEGQSFNIVERALSSGTGELRAGRGWAWSEIVTPGEENVVTAVNHAPIVDFDCPETAEPGRPIIFDSSDTVDEDGDMLNYFWDFGDGFTNILPSPEHTFFRAGAFSVHLSVYDGGASSSAEKIIVVGQSAGSVLSSDGNWDVVISEFIPNPEGRDEDGEWIEIMNKSGVRINLLNWQIDDVEGGSRPFTFTDEFWLDAGQYFVLDREESGLALNNSVDEVRLISSGGEVVDKVNYVKSYEGEAYARGENDKWFWTSLPTPDARNIISLSDSESVGEPAVGARRAKSTGKTKIQGKIIIETTLAKLKEFEVGDAVKVKGTVAVLPGIFGAQYFYIVGSPGVQVYSYKKDFPALTVGDYIEVSGELALTSGERRLKTKTKEDIVVLSHRGEPIATAKSCEAVNEETVGEIITVTGEVVKQRSSSIYLDDGSEEVLIYIKKATGINPKTIKEGEIVAITGIVNRAKSGIRIMPRSREDIVKKDIETTEAGQVLGQIEISDEWALAARDKKLELFRYLLVAAGVMIFLLLGLLYRLRKTNVIE